MNKKDKVLKFFQLLTEQKVNEAFDTYVSEQFKHHNQHTKAGRKALLEGMRDAHHQFPDMTITTKHIVEDGNNVMAHSLVKMNPDHSGFVCAHIFRFQNDKIVEFWDLATPVLEESINNDGPF